VVHATITYPFFLKVMPLKPVIHTLQKNPSRDAESINLVPEEKLKSFVLRRVKENVNRHMVNAIILYSFVLKVMQLKPVIRT
jgi:hypothetical protein